MNDPLSDNTHSDSPFHDGEKSLQSLVGKREQMEQFGRKAIRSFMPQQHRDFYAQLPFIVVGSVDEHGWPWASILPGKPGFIKSPTLTTLNINATAVKGDPLEKVLNKVNSPLGLLGIALETRRRNRVNGHISHAQPGQITVQVGQSFGNCPQYIQHRDIEFIRDVGQEGKDYDQQKITALTDQARSMITNADTFFVSSYINSQTNPDKEGVDVSHRGGRPGFVNIDCNTLTIPDYPGNNLFNTLGNFLINPKGGLIFFDFSSGNLLMLTGTVELLWDDQHVFQAFKGAQRAWTFTVHHGVILKDALPFRATLGDYSPNTLMTGTWQEANAIKAVQLNQNAWRSFAISNIEDESEDIRSFYLTPVDGNVLLPFQAGQYLTLKLCLPDSNNALIRTYTISSAPHEPHYRISVKKENNGVASSYLHNTLKLGHVIDVKAPRGDFYIDPTEKRAAVLIAGGVGITPMISMATHIYNESIRLRHQRSLTVIHAAKTVQSRAFLNDFKQLEHLSQGQIRYISVLSKPASVDKAGIDFNQSGRINANMYHELLGLDDYDFFVCGPTAFMQSQYDALLSLGVNDSRIFAETFGQSLIQRSMAIKVQPSQSPAEAIESTLIFKKSGVEQSWAQGEKTILETAEEHGLTPEFSCRSGQCGVCSVPLISGEVVYRTTPTAVINSNEVLICCAVPAKGSAVLVVDV
jgi:ferredoxin-NADP reductase/predicted pyridoxine 5'-phosphate oxidase superfamily flavin-nucleotide-binding protein